MTATLGPIGTEAQPTRMTSPLIKMEQKACQGAKPQVRG